MGLSQYQVTVEKLRRTCNPEELKFSSTLEVGPLEGNVGQERAVNAIEFGLNIRTAGYNLYVAGITGTGRNTVLRSFLRRISATREVPPDWCYVYNFVDPSRPFAVSLPAGKGRELARDLEDLIQTCRREIPRALDSEAYQRRREEISRSFQSEREALTGQVEQKAREEGFNLNVTPMGVATIPVRDGKPLSREEFDLLPEDVKKLTQEKGETLQSLVNQTVLQIRRLEKQASQRARELEQEIVLYTIAPLLDDLGEKYADFPKVIDYFQQVKQDIATNRDAFRDSEQTQPQPQPQPETAPEPRRPAEDFFHRYKVNVMVDNSRCQGAPVVIENNPTYYNLFGRVDYRVQMGTMITDIDMIKPGAIHQANGGYLVVQATDLFTSPLSWDAMKRTLKSQEARIENIGQQYSPIPTTTLNPEPIPIDVKVIMIGNPSIYRLLYLHEEDFLKLFKVKADFTTDMERTPENEALYASFISGQCREMRFRPFNNSAVAQVVDYGSRLVEHQDKLSTRFIDIADIVAEANFWAGLDDGSPMVTSEHVKKAIAEKIYRSSLIEERIQEYTADGTIKIDTEGAVAGQVNSLAVIDLGDYSFGRPGRITARTAMGRGQMVSIDRENQLSGRIHNKGFSILSGYLTGKYAQETPLAFSATIGFEQSYEEIEGDSASSTELYALLSSLADAPIKQGIAVTGSVNQRGEIQAIGGATQKIEGFYRICKVKGLTGEQGVVIPYSNINNLMLDTEVVTAAEKGQFHIYAVKTVDEGMEVITGLPMGDLRPDGTYEEGTINDRVQGKLKQMAEKARQFGRPDRRDEHGNDHDNSQEKSST